MNELLLLLKSLVLGVVEGVTEFLPISSTGHMIIVANFIGIPDKDPFFTLFEEVIQLGAILAIVVLYRKKIINSFKNLKPGGFGFKLWTGLILAFIPSGIVGFLFKNFMEEHMMSALPVAGALLVGGIWMIFAEYKFRNNNKIKRIEDVGYFEAFVIGCFQCLSILWPGFSRSASTIIGGWIVGLSTVAAAEFSFFLAIPSMVCATGYSLIKSKVALTGPEVAALIVGFVTAFLVALIVVKKFTEFLKKHQMRGFAVYRIIIGIVILLLGAFNVLKMI